MNEPPFIIGGGFLRCQASGSLPAHGERSFHGLRGSRQQPGRARAEPGGGLWPSRPAGSCPGGGVLSTSPSPWAAPPGVVPERGGGGGDKALARGRARSLPGRGGRARPGAHGEGRAPHPRPRPPALRRSGAEGRSAGAAPPPDARSGRFVLVPLHEIAPEVRHPVLGLAVRYPPARCPDHSEVRLFVPEPAA